MAHKKLSETLLISEELLKLYSPLSKNIDIDRVFPFVSLAQPFFVEKILGKALTTELQAQIENDSLTQLNKALVLKIAPCLAFWTCFLAVRGLAYDFTQKGLTKEHSENSESINEKELGEYVVTLKSQAEMFTELLIKYLCENQECYPLWRGQENECDCSKYISSPSGTTKTKYVDLIYFPNRVNPHNGCGKCK